MSEASKGTSTVEVDMSKPVEIGRGPYRVEQVVGKMSFCFQAPTKEEALQMAGIAADPASFVWDAKVVSAGEELDEHIFNGWEPVNAILLGKDGGGWPEYVWAVRRKLERPGLLIGIADDDESPPDDEPGEDLFGDGGRGISR